MSWLLRLLAAGGLWRRLAGTFEQTKTGIREAKSFAHGMMEKHVHGTLEQAELGNREAIFEMGERFYEGRGVPRDHCIAAGWFRRAADLGHVKAQTNLGMMMWIGRGCARDRAAGIQWIQAAAKQQYEPAEALYLELRKKHGGKLS
ncbi:MAG: tetratricopeptide repeat protein [Verrucomicrobiota bacterium]|jgi:TPR repeat protein|nr:tetratricopeptide repeat protein [Verrucomicrobiota bacterium]